MAFVLRLVLVYAGVFGAFGILLPFLPVWFAAKGLDERTIGAILSLATIARVATVPFVTRAADRFAAPKGAIVVVSLATALATTALAAAAQPVAIAALYMAGSAATAASLPLIEAYALRGLAERRRPYGPVRLWGSAAFIAASLATGALVTLSGPETILWLLAGVHWVTAGAAALLIPVAAMPKAGRPPRALLLLRHRPLVAVMAASGLIQGSHALIYGFGSLQWTAGGIGSGAIGLLWSLGVVAEIVLFAVSARLPPAIGPAALIAAGAAGAVLRWTAMAFDPPLAALAVLQWLHAASFGATHLGAVQLVAAQAPPGLAATAQGFLATANGIAMAAGLALSGPLNAGFGAAGYLAMALMAAAGGAALLFARERS